MGTPEPPRCVKMVPAFSDDEDLSPCGHKATLLAFTTAGEWQPWCAPHADGWPEDRLRSIGPAPSVPPVPDGLADRLRRDVQAALTEIDSTVAQSLQHVMEDAARVAVDAVLAHPAVAAALASPPAADADEYHYAVRCPDGTVGKPMNYKSDAEGEATEADRTHDGAVCAEPHEVVKRANVWTPASPPAVPTGEPEDEVVADALRRFSLYLQGRGPAPDLDALGPAERAAVEETMPGILELVGDRVALLPAPSPSGEPQGVIAELARAVADVGLAPPSPSGETAERAKAVLREQYEALGYDDGTATWLTGHGYTALSFAGLLSSPAQTPEPDLTTARSLIVQAFLDHEVRPASRRRAAANELLTKLTPLLAASPAQTDGEREWRVALGNKPGRAHIGPALAGPFPTRERADLALSVTPTEWLPRIESRVVGPWSPEPSPGAEPG